MSLLLEKIVNIIITASIKVYKGTGCMTI